jgi:hypothetical protein
LAKQDQTVTALDLHGAELLGMKVRDRDDQRVWVEAVRLALNPAMHPSWLPAVAVHSRRQEQLRIFLARVQRQVTQAVDRPLSAGEAGVDDGLPAAQVQA